MSEDSILQSVLPLLHQDPAMMLGPGDDCAVLSFGNRCLLAAVDQVASGVHYYLDTPPEKIAAKVLKRNLSDVAAMGGVPRWALLALAATAHEDAWFRRFFAGLEACAKEFDVAVAGGDLGGLPGTERREYAALTILGEVEKEFCCQRRLAKAGELLCVTGTLGDTLASGHHLDFMPRLAEGRFLAEGGWTRAMMDISDGLAQDLKRMGRAAGCAFAIDLEQLPCRNHCTAEHALTDGEDYELLFTLAPEKRLALERAWRSNVPFTVVGEVIAGEAGNISYRKDGNTLGVEDYHGYEHFQA